METLFLIVVWFIVHCPTLLFYGACAWGLVHFFGRPQLLTGLIAFSPVLVALFLAANSYAHNRRLDSAMRAVAIHPMPKSRPSLLVGYCTSVEALRKVGINTAVCRDDRTGKYWGMVQNLGDGEKRPGSKSFSPPSEYFLIRIGQMTQAHKSRRAIGYWGGPFELYFVTQKEERLVAIGGPTAEMTRPNFPPRIDMLSPMIWSHWSPPNDQDSTRYHNRVLEFLNHALANQ